MLWVKDIPAENIIKRLGLTFEEKAIGQEYIDLKASRANTARSVRLDMDHADAIAKSVIRDDPIPAIVVRKVSNGQTSKYVIAGGNHRDQACRTSGEDKRLAYVVQCSNDEFTILCRLLNTVVGKGADKSVRLQQAVDAVQAGSMTTANAAIEFMLTKSQITEQIRLNKTELKIASKTQGTNTKIPRVVALAMAAVQPDAVLDRAIELVSSTKISGQDAAKVIREAVKQTSESEQCAFIEKAIEYAKKEKSPVMSKRKTMFMRSLTILEDLVSSCKHIQDVDIATTDIVEVRERCKKLASILVRL